MKKIYQPRFPWSQVKPGQGFFIPCLDTEAVKIDGLRDALRHRIFNAKAEAVIKDGKIGVWFTR